MTRMRPRWAGPSRRVAAGIVLLGLGSLYATGRAQSPHPFGTPTADVPQPGATVTAVPGSRAQGWLSQGRSEVLARHGIVATSDPLAAQAGVARGDLIPIVEGHLLPGKTQPVTLWTIRGLPSSVQVASSLDLPAIPPPS